MKTTLAFLLLCLTATAQNYGVLLWQSVGANDSLWVFSPPTNQPYSAHIGTPIGSEVIMDSNTLFVCQQTNSVAMAAFQARVVAAQAATNAALVSAASSNLLAWQTMYAQIPQGINDSSNRIVTIGSLLASFNSGTNNAAGTNSIMRQTIQNTQVAYQYLNQIIVYLARLGGGFTNQVPEQLAH